MEWVARQYSVKRSFELIRLLIVPRSDLNRIGTRHHADIRKLLDREQRLEMEFVRGQSALRKLFAEVSLRWLITIFRQ